MIVTIDGPAGAGKSTTARALAERLGFCFLDTGALYRAVTLAARRAGVSAEDAEVVEALLARLDLDVVNGQTRLKGEDVSEAIRTPDVTRAVRPFADIRPVREFLNRIQRRFAGRQDTITEGRDQGTIVFPDAACKFFLTADPTERARRRAADFARQGRDVSVETVLGEQIERDRQDAGRSLAPLIPAADAIVVDTTDLDFDATVTLLERHVRQRMVGV